MLSTRIKKKEKKNKEKDRENCENNENVTGPYFLNILVH